MINILEKSVGTIKGVGKKYLQTLNELEIYTIRDVLYNIPYRLFLRTFTPIRELARVKSWTI